MPLHLHLYMLRDISGGLCLQIQLFIQDLNQITNEIKRMELSGTSIIPPSSS
ncbi:hypothetical protein DPMN_010209 [Dreissena polymorpha]|uniref:Uncharacterized protein n=1 Tax=Dreissena polymorpha TaxID=45954 RepID=A0A9D4N1P8_DREPO|nr:hypothetical protein DPMN_010209 [Dreissena polymorpha]